MKKKVGELFNKPIVQGNENVLSSNEILVEQKGGTISLKERVNGEIKEVSGGGTELEGEYYLAKPNGRYWKSKLATMTEEKYPVVRYLRSDLTYEQLGALGGCATLFGCCAFSAIGDQGYSPSSGYGVLYEPQVATAYRCGMDTANLTHSESIINQLAAWQECGFTMPIPGMGSVWFNGLVDFMRFSLEGELDGMSDDEVLAMASEMLMIEQVTKEEYESWYNW